MASLQDLWAIFNQDETPYQYQQVRGGGDFGAGYNVGSAIAQNIQNARINRRNNQRRNDSRGQVVNGLPGSNGSANGGVVTGAIGADENGVYGVPSQQPTPNVLYQGSPNWTMPGNNQGNSFNTIFGSDSNTGVFNSNPQSPVASSVDQALTGGGTITSANLYGQPQQQRQNMSNLRNIQEWMTADRAQGVTNPIISMMRYQAFMEPMEKQRRENNLRDAIAVLQDPNIDEQTKMKAYATLAVEMGDPFFRQNREMKEDEFYTKQGLMRNPNYSDGDSEYGGDDENARAIYSHLLSKGIPANVIAGIMGNLQAESGFNSSAVGDGGQSIGLAQWYDSRGNNLRNFAQQRGKEWNDIGTQLDFLLDEIQQSNPDLLQRMAKLSPHEAAILFHDEFERSADTPEMKARRGEYASNIFNGRRQNQRYVRDPNYVSPREKFNAEQSYRDRIARAREYRAYRTNPNNTTSSYGEPSQFSPVEFDKAKASFASSPNEKSGDMIARGLSSRYIELLNGAKGNASVARQKLYEEIKKDKSIGGALEGNEKAFDLMWDIAINAEKYATGGGQGGEKPQNPQQKNDNGNNTNKPKNINAPEYKEKNNYVFTDPLDEVHDYGAPPLTMAEIAKSGGKIGDGQIENMFDRIFSEAGSSKVTPKRKR